MEIVVAFLVGMVAGMTIMMICLCCLPLPEALEKKCESKNQITLPKDSQSSSVSSPQNFYQEW